MQFDLLDVHRIILPEEFASRFHEKFPEYYGQLEFADHLTSTGRSGT
jgi:hypothetical protein